MKQLTLCSLLLWLIIGIHTNTNLSAQKLRSLPYNPIYQQNNNNLQKGASKDYSRLCTSPVQIQVEEVVKPVCKQDSGSFTVSMSGGVSPYNIYLNGVLESEAQVDPFYTFDEMSAGAYYISIEDAELKRLTIDVALDNREVIAEGDTIDVPAILPENWVISNAGCSDLGRIKLGFDVVLRIYEVYDINDPDNEIGTLAPVVNPSLDLPVGKYFLRGQDEETACQAHYIFEIENERILRIPFLEDFSTSSIYPDTKVWEDDYALINDSYGIDPVTIGVATLDGFNQYGLPYHTPVGENDLTYGQGDVLTSRKFCLDNIENDASLYFSFYYQAQGYGDFPNLEDTLILEVAKQTTVDTIILNVIETPSTYVYFLAEDGTISDTIAIANVNVETMDDMHIFYQEIDASGVDYIYLDLTNGDTQVLDTLVIDSIQTINPAFPVVRWEKLWTSEGVEEVIPFEQLSFERVDLELNDAAYLFNDFQFRFRNWATISGNNDHWNIDYIQLDTVPPAENLRDIAHVVPISSMLNDYQAMPWNQFINHLDESLANNMNATVRNSLTNTVNLSDNYLITDLCQDEVLYEFGPQLIPGGVAGGTKQELTLNTATLKDNLIDLLGNPDFVERDSVVLQVDWVIEAGIPNEVSNDNDTLYRYQEFFDYYAYDDGTAERAFGLNGVGSKLALQFQLNEADSLQAIQVKFLDMNADVSLKEFNLSVWLEIDEGTNNDSLIFQAVNTVTPSYIDGYNRFWTYEFDEAVHLPAGTFYVGMEQTDNELLNIGFDRNHDVKERTFFNTGGEWLPSTFEGAVMIRPVFGNGNFRDNVNVGTEETLDPSSKENSFTIYPNPATNQLYFELAGVNQTNPSQIQVFDFAGREIINQATNHANSIDIQHLPKGLYLLRVLDENGQELGVSKFLKN